MDVARGLRALDAVVAAEEQAARFFRMRSLALPNNGGDKLSRYGNDLRCVRRLVCRGTLLPQAARIPI